MIRIFRPSTPPQLKVAEILSEAQAKINSSLKTLGRQERAAFSPRPWQAAKPLLAQIQHNKCCYCESPIGITDFGIIECFRPRAQYPHLAYDWNNLLVSCNVCNRNKRDLFPMADDGSAILIDPTADDPALFVSFDEAGLASSNETRGEVTIKTIGLNRSILIAQRAHAISKHRATNSNTVNDDEPYAGAIRSALAKIAKTDRGSAPLSPPTAARLEVGKKKSVRRNDKETRTGPFSYLASVRIQNVRAIEDIQLDVPLGSEESQGWKVLLGENAAGKSTVLKAVALALMGRDHLELIQEYQQGILRRTNGTSHREHASSGSVELEFVDGSKTILRLMPNGLKFTKGPEGIGGTIRGYGSMRLLPEGGDSGFTHKPRDVSNLFHPRRSLVNAESVLLNLHANDNPTFHRYASHILYLLGLGAKGDETGAHRQEIEIHEDAVWIPLHDALVRIPELSDGYQAMIALTVDLMTGFADSSSMETAPGILLLDELGTHLHPRWRMQFVDRLRNTFKGLQVIATTHEPLCLRGLKRDEVGLLRRNLDNGVELITDNLPDVEGMRTDQILTCKLFGLHSTIDPKLEAMFVRYYSLLAKQSLTDEEANQKASLAVELKPHRHLAYTRRDQMMYEVIDEFLARDSIAPERNRGRLKAETMKRLRKIWDDVGIPGLPGGPQ